MVLSKGPCPKCDTTKGNVTYADGHTFCFSCGHTAFPPGAGAAPSELQGANDRGVDRRDDPLLLPAEQDRPFRDLTNRGLKADTLRRYGYFLAGFKGNTVHVAPYHDIKTGELVSQKVRFPDKSFTVLKTTDALPINDLQLFGRATYGDRYDRQVIVTEGELDAMSVAQVVGFKKAVVSVNGGAKAAAKSIKANYLWLDRFSEIILWFDDDEPGREAAEECAQLFKVGKVRIAKAPGFKDASDCLQKGQPGDVEEAIYKASAWRPKGIVNAADNEDDVCAPKEDATTGWSFAWPWPELNDWLGPMRPGQVCYHVAGTGIGKTTGMAEIEYSLLKQGAKIAHMGFEDTRRDVKLRLLSIHISDRLDIEPRPDEQMKALHREVFGSKQVELFDPETAEWTVDAILGYVRYCAKALDCQVIIIDPLTFIAAGLSLGDDERRALDKASRDLAAMAKELGVHLQVTHHLNRPAGQAHEEGAQTSLNQVRGSGGIANFATFVIGHERDQQAEGDDALITQLRSLKNRPRSRTGPMVALKYNLSTGRLLPTRDPFPTRSGGSGGRRGFAPVPSDTETHDY